MKKKLKKTIMRIIDHKGKKHEVKVSLLDEPLYKMFMKKSRKLDKLIFGRKKK
ncbi:hypothetical protein ES702_02312 [subsurface metagenome]